MQILETLIPFATAGIVAAFSTPIVSRAASALQVVDRPSERKVNRRENIPLLGGIAVALGLFVGLATGVLLTERWVLAPLRNHTFFSLAELNHALAAQRPRPHTPRRRPTARRRRCR